MGRPSLYTPELVEVIAQRLSTGETLSAICRDDGMPDRTTVWDWQKSNEVVSQRLARAREAGEEAIIEECLAIADTPLLGVIEKMEPVKADDGTITLSVTERRQEDMLGHRKLQVDTRLKLLAIWNPRKYGNKVDLNHGGQSDNPIRALLQQVNGTSILPVSDDSGDD